MEFEICMPMKVNADNVNDFFSAGQSGVEFWNALLGKGFSKSGLKECKTLVEVLDLIGCNRKITQIKAVRSYYAA